VSFLITSAPQKTGKSKLQLMGFALTSRFLLFLMMPGFQGFQAAFGNKARVSLRYKAFQREFTSPSQ